jgi:hypothetical protein
LYVQEQDNDGYCSSNGSITIVIDTTAPFSRATGINYENGTFYFATRATDNAGNVEEQSSGEGDISYIIGNRGGSGGVFYRYLWPLT